MRDFQDFCSEERLVKKLKKGKIFLLYSNLKFTGLISKEQYKQKMKELDGSDYEDDDLGHV